MGKGERGRGKGILNFELESIVKSHRFRGTEELGCEGIRWRGVKEYGWVGILKL